MRHTLASMTQGHLEDRVAATTPVEPQPPEDADYCEGCGLDRDHEREDCDPRDVRDYVRERRDEDRMRDAGL